MAKRNAFTIQFGRRFRLTMKEAGVDKYDIAGYLKCEKREVDAYARGDRLPEPERTLKFAIYVGTTVDYLYGRD